MKNIFRKSLLVLLCASLVISTPAYTYAAPFKAEEVIEEDESVSEVKDELTDELVDESIDELSEEVAEDAEADEEIQDDEAIWMDEEAIEEERAIAEEHISKLTVNTVLSPYSYGSIDDYADGYIPSEDERIQEDSFASYYNPVNDLMTLRNQGEYGTCWAHATMAAAETSMVNAGKASASSVNYSERAIAYFLNSGVDYDDPLGNTAGDKNYRTDGNWTGGNNSVYVTRFLSGWRTVINESEAPYSGMPGAVSASKAYKNEAVLTDFRNYDNDDRANIKKAILDDGLVTCNYYASGYSNYYNYSYNSYYCPNAYSTDHAVAIVGWDDDFPATNFKSQPSGNGAWLIRNSWSSGRTYSYNGYFWMSYYDKSLMDITSYKFAKADEYYDNNYFYDGAAMYLNKSASNRASGANVFKASANNGGTEQLRAVSFVTEDTNLNYTIEIYLDPKTNSDGVVTDPFSGTKVDEATTTGMTEHTGLYSVPLASSVPLSDGQLYVVALTLEKQGYTIHMEFELDSSYYSYSWLTSKVAISPGQSFYVSNLTSSRYVQDMTKVSGFSGRAGALRIKAFTDNDGSNVITPESRITYELNGGGNNSANPMTYNHSSVIELKAPVRTGYIFEGWYREPEFKNPISQLTPDMEVGDYTFYAKWIKGTVPMPSASCVGEVKAGTKVKLSVKLSGASIYYTTDGSNPDPDNVYSSTNKKAPTKLYDADAGIIVNDDMTIKAVACKNEYYNSDILTVSYTIMEEPEESEEPDWGDILPEDQVYYASPEDVPYAYWVTGVGDVDYNGQTVTFPEMHVYYHDVLLQEKIDYKLSYSNNKNAGVSTITLSFMKNFSGTLKKTFRIRPLDIGLADVADVTVAATGSMIKSKSPLTYVIDGRTVTLKEGTDYTLSYGDLRTGAYKNASPDGDPGYVVTVIGKGNYIGTTTHFYEKIVAKKDITKASVTSIPQQNYNDGNPIEPAISVSVKKDPLTKQMTEGGAGDYKVEFINNTAPGTATVKIIGVNDYVGTKVVSFKIKGESLTPVKLKTFYGSSTYTKILDQYYTGAHLKPSFDLYKTVNKQDVRLRGISEENYQTASDAERKKYAYVYAYTNNVNEGTATVICTGINGYEGSYKSTFKILPVSLSTSSWAYSTGESHSNKPIEVDIKSSYSYVKGGVKITPTVWTRAALDEGGYTYIKRTNGLDYTLSYEANDRIGTAYVKITGKKDYKDTIKIPFNIVAGDIDDCTANATDIIYKKQAGLCEPTITITDTNGAKLAAGTDYDKNNIYYYYDKAVTVEQFENVKLKTTKTVYRAANERVNVNDIIPSGAVIRAELQGINNYSGSSTSVKFGYGSANISSAKVVIPDQKFTGRAIKPGKDKISITVNGINLEKDEYDIVSYSKNIAKGTATVVLRGKGNYAGTKNATFKIIAR